MAKIGVSVRIDVTKIEKARLYKGEKGTYLDLSTFIDLDNVDQYDNNGFISQSVTKEEREQGIQTPILGNCKVFYRENQQGYQQAPQQQRPAPKPSGHPEGVHDQPPQPAPGFDDFDPDLPF